MMETHANLSLDQSATYEIKVPGRLDESWSDWFGEMAITVESGNEGQTISTLTGIVADQAALQGLLSRLYSLGLPLLFLKCIDPKWNKLSK